MVAYSVQTFLKEEIEGLLKSKNHCEIINRLSEIGTKIISCCFFDFGKGKTMTPLWVEAYYANPLQKYVDPSMDLVRSMSLFPLEYGQLSTAFAFYRNFAVTDDAQSKERRRNSRYRRVDLVIPGLCDPSDFDNPCALSFLLKLGLLCESGGESRILTAAQIFDEIENKQVVLEEKPTPDKISLRIREKPVLDKANHEIGYCRRAFSAFNYNWPSFPIKEGKIPLTKGDYINIDKLAVFANCLESSENDWCFSYKEYSKMRLLFSETCLSERKLLKKLVDASMTK